MATRHNPLTPSCGQWTLFPAQPYLHCHGQPGSLQNWNVFCVSTRSNNTLKTVTPCCFTLLLVAIECIDLHLASLRGFGSSSLPEKCTNVLNLGHASVVTLEENCWNNTMESITCDTSGYFTISEFTKSASKCQVRL